MQCGAGDIVGKDGGVRIVPEKLKHAVASQVNLVKSN